MANRDISALRRYAGNFKWQSVRHFVL